MSDHHETDHSLLMDRLDVILHGYCRVCRLLLERFRVIYIEVERDHGMLDEEIVTRVLQSLIEDLSAHLEVATHSPLLEAGNALLRAAQARQRHGGEHAQNHS